MIFKDILRKNYNKEIEVYKIGMMEMMEITNHPVSPTRDASAPATQNVSEASARRELHRTGKIPKIIHLLEPKENDHFTTIS